MIDRSHVERAEETLGVVFPPLYRAWILEKNGGTVRFRDEEWTVNPLFDDTDRRTMRKTASHLVADTLFVRGYPTFPGNGVSIAQANVARLVLMPRGDDPKVLGEHVYYWDADLELFEVVADDVVALRRD